MHILGVYDSSSSNLLCESSGLTLVLCALNIDSSSVHARADGSIIPSIGIKVGGRRVLELHVGRRNWNGEIGDIEGLSMGSVKVCKDAWTVR